MIWLAPVCAATAAGASALAVVAHNRHLRTHRLVAATAAVAALYLAAFAIVAERNEGVHALAALVPDPVWWAATAVILGIGSLLTVALAQWLTCNTASTREARTAAGRGCQPYDPEQDDDLDELEQVECAALLGSCLDEAAGMADE